MEKYLHTVKKVLKEGRHYPDRTGKGRVRTFGGFETYDLSKGFPAVTTRYLFLKTLVKEVMGFIHGSNKVTDLGEGFWSKWSPNEDDITVEIERVKKDAETSGDEHMQKMINDPKQIEILKNYLRSKVGTIGPMYGVMWRKFPRVNGNIPDWFKGFEDFPSDLKEEYQENFMKRVMLSQGKLENTKENWEAFALQEYFKTYDQLNMVYLGLKRNPFSSRHRVTAFHPDTVGPESLSPKQNVLAGYAALAACHTFYQFMVTEKMVDGEEKKVLNCMFYMSSSDVMVGRPYNIAQYALLTMIMAHCLGYIPGELTIVSCDTHIYSNHVDQVEEEHFKREPLPLCKLVLNPEKKDFFAFTADDISFEGYQHQGRIDYEVAV